MEAFIMSATDTPTRPTRPVLPGSKFITAAQVRARYNFSNMFLSRMLADENSDFPRPVRLHKSDHPEQCIRHWAVADLDKWDAERAADQAVQ
jgi:hypothetical protein